MTCALRVTAHHADAVATTHAHNVYIQFRRHHPKSFRVTDLTGPKEENTSWFCVLGDSHFNKDSVKCPKWIPALGVSLSDAINLNLNHTMLRLTWIMLVLTALGLLNLVEPSYKLLKKIKPHTQSITNTAPQQQSQTRSDNQTKNTKQDNLPQNKGGSPIRPAALQSIQTLTQ